MRRLVASLVLLCSATAAASPLEMFGVGGRSPALGSTGVAIADDFDCVYLNPAGLASVTRKRFSIGTLLGGFDLKGVDRDVPSAAGFGIGGALPIPFGGALTNRVGFGIGIYIPGNLLNEARAPVPGTPRFALLESRAQIIGLQVGAGARIARTFSVGFSVLVLAALRGRIVVSADPSGRFTTLSEQQLISHFAPIFGARWQPSDRLTFGLTFRGTSRSSYDIDIAADLGAAVPIALPALRVAGIAQYDPLTVAAEGAWRPSRSLLVALQVAWEKWSDYPLPTQNPVEGMAPQEAPGFHDTLVPRLGVEWSHGTSTVVSLRGGYFLALSPAPEQTGQQALLDNTRHVITAGAGLAMPGGRVPLHIDAFFQAHVLQPRHHDRPGDQPDIDTSGNILLAGILVGVDL